MGTRVNASIDLLLSSAPGRLDRLTERELLESFHDYGIVDLKGLAARVVALAKEHQGSQLRKFEPISIDLAARRTSTEVAKTLCHRVPEVPVIVDGVTYEPKDIRRLDGQALHFVLVNGNDSNKYLRALRDEAKPTLAAYLYMKSVAATVDPLNWPPAPSWPSNPMPGGGGGCGWMGSQCCVCPPPIEGEPAIPHTPGQVQMFQHAQFSGDWFWLPKGFQWANLTQVDRGGIFGGDWNDEISSLSTTTSTCWYHEHANFQGSTLVVRTEGAGSVRTPGNDPTQVLWTAPIRNLADLGWNDRISSVINWSD